MPVAVWNTLRGGRILEPLDPPSVRLFVCGPTVYDASHLGHAKTYTQLDLVARYLRHRGFDVSYVQNITDIDDEIVGRANGTGDHGRQLAREQEALFLEAGDRVRGCSSARARSSGTCARCSPSSRSALAMSLPARCRAPNPS